MKIDIEKELQRLAKREITFLKIGKIEFQNNHGNLLAFYNSYLVFANARLNNGYYFGNYTENTKKILNTEWKMSRVHNLFRKLCNLVSLEKQFKIVFQNNYII